MYLFFYNETFLTRIKIFKITIIFNFNSKKQYLEQNKLILVAISVKTLNTNFHQIMLSSSEDKM
jgi:hypothetical protein